MSKLKLNLTNNWKLTKILYKYVYIFSFFKLKPLLCVLKRFVMILKLKWLDETKNTLMGSFYFAFHWKKTPSQILVKRFKTRHWISRVNLTLCKTPTLFAHPRMILILSSVCRKKIIKRFSPSLHNYSN